MDNTKSEGNLAYYIELLFVNLKTIIAITLIVFTLSVARAYLSDPIYKSVALLEVVDKSQDGMSSLQSQFGGVASLAGINLAGRDQARNTAMAIINSRGFLGEFIEANKIMPALYADNWDNDNNKWLDEDKSKQPQLWDAVDYFRDSLLFVRYNPENSMIELELEWGNPNEAAKWLEEIIKSVNLKLQTRDRERITQDIEFLKKTRSEISIKSVVEGIDYILENKIKELMLVNNNEEYALRIIDKPVAPPLDKFIFPNKKLIIIIGFIFGFMLSLVYVLGINYIRNMNLSFGGLGIKKDS